MELKNSTVLITGGTSGIGLELVKQLTQQGANIIVTGRNLNALREAKTKFPKIHTFQNDVSNPREIEQLYEDVTEQFPELNIIINNAGIMRLIDLRDATLDLANINSEIATNLSGTIQMVHQFLPHLLTKKSAAIVNVSSGIAFMAYSAAPIYSAAKAGVHAYTQALRLQLEDTNVKVFEMIPPGVKTNLQNDWVLKPSPGMMMDVDKMVGVAIKGFLKDQPELKPTMISVIKFASRLVPKTLIKYGHQEFKKIKALQNRSLK
ncbi:SDR family NAD(P)-dependent oxidoreductase [Dyadobacter chenwenxiniae]|uniref:SDR family NAD(P)-dependent oxidoreductase n=1 Tax=Dyadobacter chenwenxiniae TaxID=2906456 RepID=A0A9X1TGM6_9BACT|nr:SDR family NAD(P)-dependent oxidoreductase [Dyadobacter chenwenxiniae]MCF0063790.1 SDR family NAD(P)-dependent oxidoreductase [Dyadobacter chenwenxiniae]UON83466.1 SDR family NAD(P)-dependent oxidoreductase [Dyadobacter chenwenxiniae]